MKMPWLREGRCRVCDTTPNACHSDDCWLAAAVRDLGPHQQAQYPASIGLVSAEDALRGEAIWKQKYEEMEEQLAASEQRIDLLLALCVKLAGS